ncbi:MAG: glycoside hydrolase family 30 protein [Clostridia bacterium]|nr:glycoside hydrolase family 30 protein [Clostridia bacterium]
MSKMLLYPQNKHQVFGSFGVSGAWWAQTVGGWSETDEKSGMPKNERIAQLLFDEKEGLGIKCYRYNLGGGSKQSGNGVYDNEQRRTESFDADDYTYDFSRDANAVEMMKLAVKYGADEVVVFVNSPPERMTINGKAHCDKLFRTNLAKENYYRFAKYCLDCVEHFIDEGIPVKYLSPVNEPVWKWTGGQEGCHYNPAQVWRLLRVFADEIDKRPKLKGLKLSAAENGDIRWFNKTYCRILLDDIKIRDKLDAIDTHSYFLTPNYTILKKTIGDRPAYLKRYKKFMDRHYPGVELKTSEWCDMRGGRDYSIKSALRQTRVIMEDLKLLNVTSWQYWIALSIYDYCDGLIYEFDGPRSYRLTKRYYAFGNFSKFIRPGSRRIEVSTGTDLGSVAFENDDKYIVVVMNREKTDKELTLPCEKATAYITDADRNLEETQTGAEFIMPRKSVVTFIIDK